MSIVTSHWLPRFLTQVIASWVPLVVLLSSSNAGAAPADQEHMRVVLWREAEGTGFAARIRGQTVDLPVELVETNRAASDGRGAALAEQIASARAVAQAHQARVIVWRSSEKLCVFVATPAPSHLLVRRMGAYTAEMPPRKSSHLRAGSRATATASAKLEAGALIVRSALQAIVEGGTVGVPSVGLAAPLQAQAVARPEAQVVARPEVEAVGDQAEASNRPEKYFFLLASFQSLWDGNTDNAARSIGGHIGVGSGRLSIAATAMQTFDRNVCPCNPQAFSRRNLALAVGVDVVRVSRLRVTSEVQGGAAIYSLERDPSPVRKVFLLAGAGVRVSFDTLVTRSLRVPVWLGVGADYVPGASSLATDPSWNLLSVGSKVQPRVMLGLGFLIR